MRQGGTIELLLHGEVYVGVTHIRMISHKYEHLKQTVFLKKVLDMPWLSEDITDWFCTKKNRISLYIL